MRMRQRLMPLDLVDRTWTTGRAVLGNLLRRPVATGTMSARGTATQPAGSFDPVVPQVLMPFKPLELSRAGDHLHVRVEGSGVSVADGQILRTPGAVHSTLSVIFMTPQHWCEPAVPRPEPGQQQPDLPPDPYLHAAPRTVLGVELRPGDHVSQTLTGILTLLQTHVLTDQSRVRLPAGVALRPLPWVVADDVPIAPVDPPSGPVTVGKLRERWHFSLRSLVGERGSADAPWRRDDTTQWLVVRDGTQEPGPRPPGTLPVDDDLQKLRAQTTASEALAGHALVLSGGGASGELFGTWPGSALTLYRERFATGRTTSGMTVEKGLLYPFGLRASLVTTWQREMGGHLVKGGGVRVGAYLVSSRKIVISDLARDLGSSRAAAASPFVRVDVVNPVRDGVPAVVANSGDTESARPVPSIAYLVTDKAGRQHRLEVPGYFLADPGNSVAELDESMLGRIRQVYAPASAAAPPPTGSTNGPAESAAALRSGSDKLSRAFLATTGTRIAYTPQDSTVLGSGSELTSELRFRFAGVPSPQSWLRQPPLPEVDWFQADLSHVAQFTGKPVSATMRYPAAPGPTVLLELVEPVAVLPSTSDVSQTFAALACRMNAVTAAGTTFVPRSTDLTGPFDPADLPRLLGLFDLTQLMQKITAPVIEASEERRTFSYATTLKAGSYPVVGAPGAGALIPTLVVQADSTLILNSTVAAGSATSTTTITGTSVSLADLIVVPLTKVELVSHGGHVRLAPKSKIEAPRLVGQLQLVQEVLESLPSDLFGDGPSVRLTGSTLTATIAVDVPSIAFGAFSIRNLTVEVSVIFGVGGGGVGVKLALGTVARPFQIGVGIFVGGGHLGVELVWDGSHLAPVIEGSIELGAGVAIDLALASGVVEAVAGLWLEVEQDVVRVGGYVRLLGTVRVKYLGSMTVRTDLNLAFDGKCTVSGHGSYTIEIDVWFLSTSFSVRFDYSFKTAKNDPPLLALLATSRGADTEWDDYWAAFDDLRSL